MIRDKYHGPARLMRDRDGYAVVTFGRHPDCPELPRDYTASVHGWGSQLVAAGPDLAELARHFAGHFGKVRVVVGGVDPLGWGEANW